MNTDKGSTNVSVPFYITQDVGGTNPGEPKTGMAFGDLTSASYSRQGAARVAITPITQTPAGAHSDGGFVEIDATNMPGYYRFDPPDAAFASGVDFVTISLVPTGGQNAVASPLLVDLITVMRGTDLALLAASAPTNFGLLTIDGAGSTNAFTAGILDTALAETTTGNLADNFDTFYDNANALTAKVVDDVGGASVSDILTTQMTEDYAADGVAPTLAQALFLIQQTIGDFAIAGTTITTKRLDGSTTAATYTLDDGTNPTSRTRAT